MSTNETSNFPSSWDSQALFLIVFSLVLALFFSQSVSRLKLLSLLFQIIIFLVLSYPGLVHAALYFLMVTVLLVQIMSLNTGRIFFALSFIILFVLSLFLPHVSAWGQPITMPPISLRIYIIGYTLLLVLHLEMLRRLQIAIEKKGHEIMLLKAAMLDVLKLNIEFQNQVIAVRDMSVVEERKRLARELHDIIGYTMVNVNVLFEMARDHILPEQKKLEDIISQGQEHAKQGLQEARLALRALRKPLSNDYDWRVHITRLTQNFSIVTGIACSINFANARYHYHDGLTNFIIHLVQEGLTNAYSHGKASEVVIKFWQDEEGLEITVSDNGRGSDVVIPGIGLQGMQERVNALQGSISYHNSDFGFEIIARIATGGPSDGH